MSLDDILALISLGIALVVLVCLAMVWVSGIRLRRRKLSRHSQRRRHAAH